MKRAINPPIFVYGSRVIGNNYKGIGPMRSSHSTLWTAFEDAEGGEIYVKKIPSMKVVDLAKTIAPNAELENIGIRPGEKLHEIMISIEDAMFTYEYDKYYKILPSIHNWYADETRIKDGKKVIDGFSYTSDNNKEWMTKEELNKWIDTDFHNMVKV